MSDAVVVATGLGRHYRGRAVVEDVNVEVAAGEVLGLIGPNGGGKSTLLLLMAGLVTPTMGGVTVRGVPATRIALTHRGMVGLITAQHGLYPLLTGRENLAFFAGLFGISPRDAERRAAPLLEGLGMTGALGDRVAVYSSGMRQKLSLVRATLLDPSVLLLDEPTSALDPVSAQTIHSSVRDLADRGLAVVIVTHDLHAAQSICDRAAVLDRTVLHVEVLGGVREPPATGRLFDLYRSLVHP